MSELLIEKTPEAMAAWSRQVLRSGQGLGRENGGWIADWNGDPRPYVWVKTADQILDSLARYCMRISNSAR